MQKDDLDGTCGGIDLAQLVLGARDKVTKISASRRDTPPGRKPVSRLGARPTRTLAVPDAEPQQNHLSAIVGWS